MKEYSHVIWDFNGTVLNDMQAGIDSVNIMLSERGLPVIRNLDHYRELFDFPIEGYYGRLGFDFTKESYHDILAPLWVKLYREHSADAPLFEGVRELAGALRRAGKKQSILSVSHSGLMRQQLLERGALDWFDEIWGTDTIHAYGKTEIARSWRVAHPDAVPVLLGDTTHDFEVSREIGADCILIAAGHHARKKLEGCGVPVVDSLAECFSLLSVAPL